MKATREYKKAMAELFAALPYGAIQQICAEAGVSRAAVYAVRDCKFHNAQVIESAKEIIRKTNADSQTAQAELEQFLNEEVKATISA